jgi:hypothetical protein
MRDDLRACKRSMVHSVRAVLGYRCVSATGSLCDRDARLANSVLLARVDPVRTLRLEN